MSIAGQDWWFHSAREISQLKRILPQVLDG
jgi:hypothetical protein